MVYDSESFLEDYSILLPGFGVDVGFLGMLSTFEIWRVDDEAGIRGNK